MEAAAGSRVLPQMNFNQNSTPLSPEAKSISAFFGISGNSMQSISNGKGNSNARGLSISRSVEKDIVGRTNCSAGVFTYPGNAIESHSQVEEEKIGVILLNLGGPETLQDVQLFLFNLFVDPVCTFMAVMCT